ncbi:MAG: succinate dehydrogenase [Actinobacteria bacterium]|nr:succinate dehydrogenase [Actinomycetota bacterium]
MDASTYRRRPHLGRAEARKSGRRVRPSPLSVSSVISLGLGSAGRRPVPVTAASKKGLLVTATKEPPALTPDISSPTIRKANRRSNFAIIDLYKSSVGKKWIMALTGIMLMGFVLFHMIGNLKMYLGESHFNEYAEFLRQLLVPIVPPTGVLWILRVGLIGAFALHIQSAYALTRINHKARPVNYKSPRDYVAVNWAARTMRWSGIIVGLFLLWHLADLTWGWANPDFVNGNPYANVASSLDRAPVAALYILANIALGFHLYHGAWSIFQSLGSMSARFNPRHNPLRRGFAAGFAILVAGVNITFPIAVLTGVVG